MCLTGRFSLFRAQAALDPSFADQLEIDTLDDWLWGQFKFLSGDDKSTWFWLLKQGYEMIYVPDTIVYSIETISGSLVDRAYQNMRRWYGNMLRNSDRAIALGPQKNGWFMWWCLLENGWFMWWCLIDQRISYWTSLITPGLLLIALLQAQWLAAGIIISWVIFSRPLMLVVVFWKRQSHLKPIHFPLLLLSQWSSALVKIWTQMNLAQQKWTNRGNQSISAEWTNRGNQSISAEGSGWVRWVKISTSRFLLVTQMFCFVVVLLSLANLLNPLQDLAGMWWHSQARAASPSQIITAIDQGIYPNDGKDDSAALQALIDKLPSKGKVQINLPIGEIELFRPIQIQRSHTIIQGQGVGRTILQAKFGSQIGDAVISIRPGKGKAVKNTVKNVYLQGFTLMPNSSKTGDKAINSIVLEKVAQSGIKNLEIKPNGGHALTFRQTQNIKVEYVTMDSN